MYTNLATFTLCAVMGIASVQAHIGLWHPSVYGFAKTDYDLVTPMHKLPFNQWWFHGYLSDQPQEVMTIEAGKDLTVQVACHKRFTTYGSNPSSAACPSDSGSYHAGGKTGTAEGWGANSEANLAGCALAIAFKNKASDVKMEDFTIMSVQENCVRYRDTTFAIPANLPACPNGGECVCAWFWQGKISQDEMYMNGFRCTVKNGVATKAYPKPSAPIRGNIKGPVQPLYWANDVSNLGYTPSWETKPMYNRQHGFKNGAQTAAFMNLPLIEAAEPEVKPTTPKKYRCRNKK